MKVAGEYLYLGESHTNPRVGDVRIKFRVATPTRITVVAGCLSDWHHMCFRRIDLQHLLGFGPVRASPDPGADQSWPGGGARP